jgi:glycine oxidase
MPSHTADAIIIGDGVIGLSTAYELARGGVSCRVLGAANAGVASHAAAGLLAPSIGQLSGDVATFFDASLDLYPALVDRLSEFDAGLRLLTGLVEVLSPSSAARTAPGASRLTAGEAATLEPNIEAPHGALLHRRDAAVDNVRLVAALRSALDASARVVATVDRVTRIDPPAAKVTLENGEVLSADVVVLAAGAWSPLIAGIPGDLPVSPLKGQMLALHSSAVRHPVMGDDVYLVPRGDELAVGATVESAGFDTSTDPAAIDALHAAAARLVPALARASVTRQWAGIRPATPDRLPIIGADPDHPRLVYACGHTKNGILLAPATAVAVRSVVEGVTAPWPLAPFAVSRFRRHPETHNP